MNPTTFKELGGITGLNDPLPTAFEAADPTVCPARKNAKRSDRRPEIESADCTLLTAECGRSVGVSRAVCKRCLCNGPADASKNPALRKHICQVAWSSTIAGELALEPLSPSDEEVSTAVENVKRWLGEDMARRFIDALVYHESVTPEKGAELAAGLGAVS